MSERKSQRPTAPADPLVGQVFHDRFKILALVAKGGMGKVYKAEQAPLGRICAVKVLTPPADPEQREEFRKRFFLEASVGSKLTHPNTVTIFDYGVTDDGTYFMAMEFLDGRTLAKALREDGPFTEARAAHVARQVCRSLREAHALGVVHRDLKAANVFLIDKGDENDFAKVLDFGLVKNVTQDSSEDLTQAGLFMGSPKYMSPEQIRGEHVDARTDIYALGVLMFEMIAGRVPFDKPNQVDTLLAHVNDEVPAVHAVRPESDASEPFESVIRRCLAKDAAQRFASMDEALQALRQTPGGQVTGTGALHAISSDALLRASASFTPQPSALSPSPSSPVPATSSSTAPPPQKRGKGLVVALAVAAVALVGVIVALSTRKTESTATAAPASTSANADPQTTGESKPKPTASTVMVASTTAPVVPKVDVDTDPTGARIRDEAGMVLCDKTPCKLTVDKPLTLQIDSEGYETQKVKIAVGDPARTVKLTKKAAAATWTPPPKPTGNGTTAPPPPPGGYHPDPY